MHKFSKGVSRNAPTKDSHYNHVKILDINFLSATMTVTTYKWSISEWHDLVDTGVLEGKPVELLNGEIIEMSPEREQHTFTNDDVAEMFREKFKGLAKIRESHPITLDNSEPEPDIAVVRSPKTIYKEHHPYPEDIYLLIEVSNNTLKIDLETKAQIYARNNIPEYWVVDLANKQVIVHTQPSGDTYSQVVKYKSGVISPQAFPNITIPLNQLLLF